MFGKASEVIRASNDGIKTTKRTVDYMMKNNILSVVKLSCLAAATIGFLVPTAQAGGPCSESPHTITIFFVRHGEDADEMLLEPSYTITFNNAVGSCHETVLNPLGKMRATVLADWFEAQKITKTLTHVVATHKIRTRQTVQPIAQAAGLSGANDLVMDQMPGDGVINVPWWPWECEAGWTSSKSVIQPQTNFINTLPLGSRVVLCSHSPALYPIMQAYGIDTSDPVLFPKDPTDPNKVGGFNNLWAVELKPVQVGSTWGYKGRLLAHALLDFQIEVSPIDPKHGNGQSCQSNASHINHRGPDDDSDDKN